MDNENVLIIAEIGVNHNGSFETAKKLIDVAKEAGADIAKFQTAKLDSLVSKKAHMAEYQKENMGVEKSQKDMLKELLLSFEDFKKLSDYCKEVGIKFLSTPFDIESIRFLDELQDIWKIPSGEITNFPYLVEIAKTGKKIILSTGMCTLDEVENALNVLKNNGASDITLLHCTTDYPTAMEDVNLNAMLTLKNEFNLPVGYSDHTKGIEVSVAAVAMGARVIEKHFTLDRNMPGPDHKASLEPEELKALVSSVRNVEKAKGSFEKKPTAAEFKNREVARKSIVAAKYIKKGDLFTEDNLTTKRPGDGISPMRWEEFLGKTADRDYEEDDLIQE
ncbi:MAG: N-acetylneuraminate synthase [Lachnospiraceae bacterium]|nr:N-acetylneuraminate synthase [Lachnospiraceae bacterium]